jgi:hypothetical protein
LTGEIEPVYDYTKHTIKALMSFIESGFRTYSEETERREGKLSKEFWGCDRYKDFLGLDKVKDQSELIDTIHRDILRTYEDVKWRIAPKQLRIAYLINNIKKNINIVFFNIQYANKGMLLTHIKSLNDPRNPKNIIISKSEVSDGYRLHIKNETDYDACKELIKNSYNYVKKYR